MMSQSYPRAQVERFLESWIEGQNGIAYTPGGLAWASEWASNRFVGNAAMIAAVYASHIQGVWNALRNAVRLYRTCRNEAWRQCSKEPADYPTLIKS